MTIIITHDPLLLPPKKKKKNGGKFENNIGFLNDFICLGVSFSLIQINRII